MNVVVLTACQSVPAAIVTEEPNVAATPFIVIDLFASFSFVIFAFETFTVVTASVASLAAVIVPSAGVVGTSITSVPFEYKIL